MPTGTAPFPWPGQRSSAGARWLGVAHISEALALRAAGIEAPLLAWLHTPESNFGAAVAAGIDIGCSGWELERIVAAAREQERPARVHLKVDTGLGRNGATLDAWDGLVGEAMEYQDQGLLRVVGIFSHLAVADEPERPETDDQLAAFREVLAIAEDAGVDPEVRHLANTPATLSRPDTHFDLVRVGLGIYGLSPFEGQSSAELGLRPAMTVRTVVSHCKDVPAGQGVSYGLNYHTAGTSTLGLIPLGYADGVPRVATGGPVRVEGVNYPVVGRIAMDQMVIDLGPLDVSAGGRSVLGAEARAVRQRRRRRTDGGGLGPGGRHQQLRDRHPDQPARAAPLHQRRAAADRARASATPTPESRHSERPRVGADAGSADGRTDPRPRRGPRRRSWRPGTWWSSPASWGRARPRSPRGSARAWASAPGIISPTFVLVRIHPNLPDGPRPGGPDLVHVDAYRLASASEIDDIDLENTLDSAVTVVEWGRGRVEHLSDSRLEVDLRPHRSAAPHRSAGRRPGALGPTPAR